MKIRITLLPLLFTSFLAQAWPGPSNDEAYISASTAFDKRVFTCWPGTDKKGVGLDIKGVEWWVGDLPLTKKMTRIDHEESFREGHKVVTLVIHKIPDGLMDKKIRCRITTVDDQLKISPELSFSGNHPVTRKFGDQARLRNSLAVSPPEHTVTTPYGMASFLCSPPAGDISSYFWLLNNQTLPGRTNETGVVSEFVESSIGNFGAMVLSGIRPEQNNTIVQCKAVFHNGEEQVSSETQLQLQGTLEQPQDPDVYLDRFSLKELNELVYDKSESSHLTLVVMNTECSDVKTGLPKVSTTVSWTAPFTLRFAIDGPDIKYCVAVVDLNNWQISDSDDEESVIDFAASLKMKSGYLDYEFENKDLLLFQECNVVSTFISFDLETSDLVCGNLFARVIPG